MLDRSSCGVGAAKAPMTKRVLTRLLGDARNRKNCSMLDTLLVTWLPSLAPH